MNPNEITIELLKEILNDSIISVYEKDKRLIVDGINEPSISSQLKKYIEENLKEYDIRLDVDCEYDGDAENVAGNGKKVLNVNGERVRIMPDIIVHTRGINQNNKLIVEVKSKDITDFEHDHNKLIQATNESNVVGVSNLNYLLGASVFFDIDRPIIEYFRNNEGHLYI